MLLLQILFRNLIFRESETNFTQALHHGLTKWSNQARVNSINPKVIKVDEPDLDSSSEFWISLDGISNDFFRGR